MKLFRHMEFGRTGEMEMARHLTALDFPHVPPLIGAITRTRPEGGSAQVALAYGFVRNQGNAAGWTLAQVQRALDAAALPDGGHQHFEEEVAGVLRLLRASARRLAELHAVLSAPAADPAFAPGVASADEIDGWLRETMDAVRAAPDALFGVDRDWLGAQMRERIAGPLAGTDVPVIRTHGRFDLDHLLVSGSDAVITGAQGERANGWRDVAELLASLVYTLARVTAGEAGVARDASELRAELLSAFRSRAERAVLAAYAEGAPDGGRGRPLLDLFLMEALARRLQTGSDLRPGERREIAAGLERVAARLARQEAALDA